MDTSIHIADIYRRLTNLYDKTVQFHNALKRLINRIGAHPELMEYLTVKVERKKRFAKELENAIKDLVRSELGERPIRRPVALFWLPEKKLSNAPCVETARFLVHSADMKAANEYGYLLNLPSVPIPIQELALEHRNALTGGTGGLSPTRTVVPSENEYGKGATTKAEKEQSIH